MIWVTNLLLLLVIAGAYVYGVKVGLREGRKRGYDHGKQDGYAEVLYGAAG